MANFIELFFFFFYLIERKSIAAVIIPKGEFVIAWDNYFVVNW